MNKIGNILKLYLSPPFSVKAIVIIFSLFFVCFSLIGDQVQDNQTPAPVIKSACEYDYPPYCLVKDGKAEGFSVELLRAVLKEMRYQVSFETGPWKKLKQDLADGKIQVLPLVGRTPEREKIFDFTIPYLTMHGTIVVRDKETGIKSFADLKGKKIAVLAADNAEEFLKRSKLDCEIIRTKTFAEALRQLSMGKHDAVVIQKLLALQLIKNLNLTNLKTAGPPLKEFKQSFCFAVKEGDKALLAVLNEGLAIVIANQAFRRLYVKWFAPIEMSGKSVIIIGGDRDAPPYEFIDENGKPAGCIVDLSHAIAREMGMTIEIRLDDWSKTRKALSQKEIDIVQGMFYSTERDKVFDFSLSHHGIENVIATRKAQPRLNTLDDLVGKSILVLNGDIMHDIAIKKGYEKQLIVVASQEEELRLLSEGKYDCALVSKITAQYWIRKDKLKNLILSDKSLHHSEYCYAVPHGSEALLARFSEGLEKIKRSGEYEKIHRKWFAPYEEQTLSFHDAIKFALLVVVPLIVLVLILFVWSKTLKRVVAQRTAELNDESEGRKKAMIALEHSEKKYRLLFNEMLSGFALHEMIFDEHGKPIDYRFIDVNKAFEKITGLEAKEIIGKTVMEVLPETEDYWIKTYGDVVTIGQAHRFEHYSKEFEKYFDVVAFRPMEGFFACIFLDITDRKEMEDQLRQSEKMQAIGQLAGGIAHDFNNQLAGVMGFADLLIMKLEDPSLISFAQNIKASAKRSAALTKQLLAFSRKGKTLLISVDMNKVLGEVVSMLEHTIDKRIKVKQILNANPATTLGDPNQLQNAILNIALNARDAMPEGGRLIFETDIVPLDEEFSRHQLFDIKPGKFVKITITDDGCGMDEDTMQHMFEPFFTTKDIGKGTGMGLASVYGVIMNHQGTITVDSELGKGSTFCIFLPVGESAETSEKQEVNTEMKGSAHILVVDDEEMVRELASEALKHIGYKVTSCKDGQEAVEYYRKSWKDVDLVILDMIMPRMGGKDTFLAMRKINPKVKVLLASGYSIDGEAQSILDQGCLGFISKPFSHSELSEGVALALQGKNYQSDV